MLIIKSFSHPGNSQNDDTSITCSLRRQGNGAIPFWKPQLEDRRNEQLMLTQFPEATSNEHGALGVREHAQLSKGEQSVGARVGAAHG